ncbi:MAG: hypothetical protein M3Z31_13415 [Pseudomonadota bacterium]|nr:hypothetical protein [Pseudomonadota bacterium]
MIRPRHFRVALLTLLSVALMQLALATYACPVVTSTTGPTGMAMQSPCDSGDVMPASGDAALCVEHCKVGAQHVDNLDLPQLITAPLIAPLHVATVTDLAPRSTAIGVLAHPPPDHTLLHCCFRL